VRTTGNAWQFFDLLEGGGLGGNLVTDALIAAHAIENAATLFSNDRDFDRFSGLKWTNPLPARPIRTIEPTIPHSR